MKPVTILATCDIQPSEGDHLSSLAALDLVQGAILVGGGCAAISGGRCRTVPSGPLTSQETLQAVMAHVETEHMIVVPAGRRISMEPWALEAMVRQARASGAGIVYSDFYEGTKEGQVLHPLNDCQAGSVRDDFDFGPVVLLSAPAVRAVLARYGAVPGLTWAGMYDLRLKLSVDYPILHMPEPLYGALSLKGPPSQAHLFAYVDPRNAEAQREMERVFTDHLRRIGAYLPAHGLRDAKRTGYSFPVEASVIIPVKNRVGTVSQAVDSALSQEADFAFNVIVVDNHSTDGTTDILARLAERHGNLHHMVPGSRGLAIGGCWNEAVNSPFCGRYAVQLDSDDLYCGRRTLQTVVDKLREGPFAMVIGSYTLVDERLEEIPPGLVAHSEWTDENGHNNALRVNGLGAPRAFDTACIRDIGFLNVSYGEDYAAALRLCREYRIGRIFQSLYLCRRWSGNTDAALSVEAANRNDAFKDAVRTEEIRARQALNGVAPHPSGGYRG